MLEFPRWKVWLVSLVVALGVLLSIPSLIAGTPLGAQLAQVVAAVQDQPWSRPCRRKPPAARGRRSRRAEAAAPGDGGFGRDRASPRPEDRYRRHFHRRRALSFMVRDPTQVDAAVERMRNLTQPVALTGNRDWDVQVVDSTRDRPDADAERHGAGAEGRDERRPRRRSPPHRSRRAPRKSPSSPKAATASSSRSRASRIPRRSRG